MKLIWFGERTRPRVLISALSPASLFKVRVGEGAIASTRGACAPRKTL
jgi:hypothetical protein